MKSITALHSFLERIKTDSRDIDVEEADYEILDMFVKGDIKKFENLDETKLAELRDKYGISISKDQAGLLYLGSCSLQWKRPEKKMGEGYLSGGFAFNDMTDIFKFKTEFWQKSYHKLEKLGEQHLMNIKGLEELRWFESPTPTSGPEYSPQFGCIKYVKGKTPSEFYYYDSGLLYQLPFTSFEEYITALVNCAAVRCWQYFHIPSEEIVSRNKGLNYATWSLHMNSNMESGLNNLEYKESAKSDRLDLINEYLERCLRLLPTSFPFLDFAKQKGFYTEFEKRYKKVSGK